MTRFKEALLDELVAHAQLPAPTARPARQRRVRVIRLGLAGAGVASLVAVAVTASVVGPSGQQAAYAVERHPDGTVTITFRELADPEQATRDLRAAGVPAQVVQLAWPGSCATTPRGVPVPMPSPGTAAGYDVRMPSPFPYRGGKPEVLAVVPIVPPALQPREALSINPRAIPPGAELFILEAPDPVFGLRVGVRLVKAPAPTCWEAASVSPSRSEPAKGSAAPTN